MKPGFLNSLYERERSESSGRDWARYSFFSRVRSTYLQMFMVYELMDCREGVSLKPGLRFSYSRSKASMYLAIFPAMAVMVPNSGRQMQLCTQLSDFRCYWEASSRMVKVETALEPWWLNLYYLASSPSLKRPTKDSPPLRYCTPKPLSCPYEEQLPKDLTQSQVRLIVIPNFFSCLALFPARLNKTVSSSSFTYWYRLKLIFPSSTAMLQRKARGLIRAGLWNTLPSADASSAISLLSLAVNTPLGSSILRSYLLTSLLLAAGVPSFLSWQRSNILILHCNLTRSYLDDSLLEALWSMVVSWSSFLANSNTQNTLFLPSIAATSLCHSTALLFSPARVMNTFSPSRCTPTIPTGRLPSKAPQRVCPEAVRTKESPLSMVPLHLESMKLNQSSSTTPVPSNCCSLRASRSKQP